MNATATPTTMIGTDKQVAWATKIAAVLPRTLRHRVTHAKIAIDYRDDGHAAILWAHESGSRTDAEVEAEADAVIASIGDMAGVYADATARAQALGTHAAYGTVSRIEHAHRDAEHAKTMLEPARRGVLMSRAAEAPYAYLIAAHTLLALVSIVRPADVATT